MPVRSHVSVHCVFILHYVCYFLSFSLLINSHEIVVPGAVKIGLGFSGFTEIPHLILIFQDFSIFVQPLGLEF